jgi:hypothetical protein
MSGVVKGRGHPWGDFEQVAVSRALESSNHLADVIGIVKGSDASLSLPLFPLIDVAAVTDLDMSRIFQHEFRQVGGGSGEVHFPGKTVFLEHRQGAGMVDVGMGQQDGTDRMRIEAQVLVLAKRLLSAPLKEPAIQQQPASG